MNTDELYSKRINIIIKTHDRENRKCPIQITMETQMVTTPIHRKELVLRLTDEVDLFFLYTLRLGEDDFHSLKAQQGLLVDFVAFPQKVIDLLNMCLQEQHKENPKFILQFESNSLGGGEMCSAVLNFIETNPFKHLTHLALKFLPATDSDLKKHLAHCLQQMKDTNALIQQRLEYTDSDLNNKLRQTQEALSSSTVELERLKSDWTSKMTEISAKHHEQLNFEREKALNKLSETQQRFESERRDLEQAHMKIVKSNESRIFELDSLNKELSTRRYKGDSEIHELRSKLSLLDDENIRCKQDVQSLRKQNADLEAECHCQEKVSHQQTTRIAVLEQEVKDGQQRVARSGDQLDSEMAYKRKLEEDIESKQKETARLENKVKMMSDELKKGNEIIKKLQSEIKNYHTKIKLRTHIATEQEKLLSEKDEELEKLRQELSSMNTELSTTRDENKKFSENLETTVQKLEESRQLLKTNENVIQWLNKQINDTQIQRPLPPSYDTPTDILARQRLANPPLHNLSASTFASTRTYASSDAMPRSYRPTQVQYNPGSNITPVASTGLKSSPVMPSTHVHSPGSASKEIHPPLIDARYLVRRDGSSPTPHAPPTSLATSLAPKHPYTLLTQKPANKVIQPPLASAYFPTQAKLA